VILTLWRDMRDLPLDCKAQAGRELATATIFAFAPQLVIAIAFSFAGPYTFSALRAVLHELFHNGEIYMISVALVAPLAYGIAFRPDMPQRPVFFLALGGIVGVSTIAVLAQYFHNANVRPVFYLASIIVVLLTLAVLYCEFAFEAFRDQNAPANRLAQDAAAFANEFNEGAE